MVLFNKPVDKQQIMTLFRQMYPENSQHLLRPLKRLPLSLMDTYWLT